MDVFNNLEKIVTDYICRDEVIDNDEVISIYSLYSILTEELEKFRYIREDNHRLLEKINNYYNMLYHSKITKYYRNIVNLDIVFPKIGPCQFKKITSDIVDDKTFVINLYPNGKKNTDKCISIYKDINDDNYYGDNLNYSFITEFKNEFDSIFDSLEFFSKISRKDKRTSQYIHNGIFDITLNYNLNGNVSLDLKLTDRIDPNNSQNKKYYNSPYTITHIIQKYKKEILLNTPIKKDELNYLCLSLVNRHKEKAKVLEKKK